MKFLLMVYTDDSLLEALPEGAFDRMMHGCITHADELKAQGTLIESQQLEHGLRCTDLCPDGLEQIGLARKAAAAVPVHAKEIREVL